MIMDSPDDRISYAILLLMLLKLFREFFFEMQSDWLDFTIYFL